MTCPPVLFVIFKRVDQTEKVFEAIKVAKPPKLFVVSDGARPQVPGETELVERCRKITEQVDWDCEVSRLYRAENLGSYYSIPDGISWFFSNVEEGVVLEDDCLPAPTFFRYCETLLEKHRNDSRIWWINGTNIDFQHNETHGNGYMFSKYPNSWGWASWRSRWQAHDQSMQHWRDSRKKKDNPVNSLPFQKKLYWKSVFDWAAAFPNWDYRVVCTCALNGGLACVPKVNQIKNIGIGDKYAVHTRSKDDVLGEMTTSEMQFPLEYEERVETNTELDEHLEKNLYKISYKQILQKQLFLKFPSTMTKLRKIAFQ